MVNHKKLRWTSKIIASTIFCFVCLFYSSYRAYDTYSNTKYEATILNVYSTVYRDSFDQTQATVDLHIGNNTYSNVKLVKHDRRFTFERGEKLKVYWERNNKKFVENIRIYEPVRMYTPLVIVFIIGCIFSIRILKKFWKNPKGESHV